jgi:hypothetical protein
MPTTYAAVDFPPPTVTGAPCPACQGAGVTGDRYELPTNGPVLLVQVFCHACGGCGSADPDHLSCAGPHAWDTEPDSDSCPSCQGREWNPVQAFPLVDPGTDADPVTLRVPCGCTTTTTTTRARLWTDTAEQERLPAVRKDNDDDDC